MSTDRRNIQQEDTGSRSIGDSSANRRIDSIADERVQNNVMRHEYRVLTDQEKVNMKAVKDTGLNFMIMCDNLGQSRELSLAKTKIEEAVFWAVKHITK